MFLHQFEYERIGCCLYGEVFLESLVPRESRLDIIDVIDDAFFIIDIKRCRDLLIDQLCCLFVDKRFFFTLLLLFHKTFDSALGTIASQALALIFGLCDYILSFYS